MKTKNSKFLNLEKLLIFLRQRYGHILLAFVLLAISILSIKMGLHLLSNDNYSPELNPWMSVMRYLESPAWRSYRVLGFASDSEQADIFRSGLFGISNLILPAWTLAQLFSLLCLWVGTFSMAYLTTYFARDFVKTKYSNLVFLTSGVIYVTTLWTAWVFNFNMMPYVTQFGFLPLLLLRGYVLLKEWNIRNLILFFISSILFTSASVIATLFFVNIVFIVFLFLLFGLLHESKLKKIFLTLLLFISTQLFWLLPFVQYTVSTSNDVIDSYTNRTITANTIDLESQMMTLVNSARFYTRLLGTVDDPAVDSYIFPMSEDYMGYDFYKVIALLPIALSIVGLIFTISKKNWKILPIWLLVLGTVILITNQNPPFGFVYTWLQEHFNIFSQVFRWVSSKLGQAYLISLALTAPLGFLYLADFWTNFMSKRTAKYFVVLLAIILFSPLLFYSEYLIRGDLFTKRATVTLPNEYYELAEYLKEDTSGRIFYAPPANNGYFREYTWGFVGSQFLGYILPNPILDMSLAIGSSAGERGMLELRNDFNSGEKEELNADLNKYDVKYVLVDRSLIKGRYGHEMNWKDLEEYVNDWSLVWSSTNLQLYSLPDVENVKLVEALGESDKYKTNFFERNMPTDPQLNIFALNMNGAQLKNGYIKKEFEYTGNSTILYSNINSLNKDELPTRWQLINNKIEVTPLVPNINGTEYGDKKSVQVTETASTYIIGKNVYSTDSLLEGVNTGVNWKDVENISLISEKSFVKTNYTEKFAKLLAQDCSGQEYSVLPTITTEKDSTGFTLQGDTDLPCIYQKMPLNASKQYIAKLQLNWEAASDTSIGYCFYSSEKKGCINKEKFIYAPNGVGDTEFVIPEVISGKDEISLTIYALNQKGERAKVVIRDLAISFATEMETKSLSLFSNKNLSRPLYLEKGSKYIVNIPVFSSDSSYVFDAQRQLNTLWQPSTAEDSSLLYSVRFNGGMEQAVKNQYVNQYQSLFNTISSSKYLWYWGGENISNIPSTLCLTYSGDDKCWVDDTFFDGIDTSMTQSFLPSKSQFTRLEGSYNSISFSKDSFNVLKSFVVIPIPIEWYKHEYSPSLVEEYREVQASSITSSPHSTFYTYSENPKGNNILTIPQSESNGWVALQLSKSKINVLGNETKVSVNGWKQGWDISNLGQYNQILIFYWPNLLAYIGYGIISVLSIIFLIRLVKSKHKYAK